MIVLAGMAGRLGSAQKEEPVSLIGSSLSLIPCSAETSPLAGRRVRRLFQMIEVGLVGSRRAQFERA